MNIAQNPNSELSVPKTVMHMSVLMDLRRMIPWSWLVCVFL